MRIEHNAMPWPLDSASVHQMRRRLMAGSAKGVEGNDPLAQAGQGPGLTMAATASTADVFDLGSAAPPNVNTVLHHRRREIHDDLMKSLTGPAAASPSDVKTEMLQSPAAGEGATQSAAQRLEGTPLTSDGTAAPPDVNAVLHHRRREIHDDAMKGLTGPAEASDSDESAIHSTAQRLEGVFLTSLITRMREASNVQFFGDTPGSQVFEGMFDQMMGDALAEKRGVGLYKEIERSMRGERHAASRVDLTGDVQGRLARLRSIQS